MLRLYRYALGPVLLAQGRRVRRAALRLPEAAGPREGYLRRSGARPLRLLFLGDSSAAGVGVAHQSQALAAPAARRIAERLDRDVAWQLVARSGVSTAEARSLLDASNLGPADVLVTAVGTNDVTAERAPRDFLAGYADLVREAFTRAGARAAVITGLPPMRVLPLAPQPLRWYLGRYASRLDALLARWCDSRDDLSHLSLEWAARPEEMAVDRFHPGPGQYRRWSELVTDHVVRLVERTEATPAR